MTDYQGPLLTQTEVHQMRVARLAGSTLLDCSLDLCRSSARIRLGDRTWTWEGNDFPYLERAKERTVYYWAEDEFQAASRYRSSLIKLVPTAWGPPTFEIDGIKMLPSAHVSPYEDAQRKVGLIDPRGKLVLDTCGGLGYFADWCLRAGARQVQSYEINPDVLWLRTLNPWSPRPHERLLQHLDDVTHGILQLRTESVDAALHDPPRFGIAGELYSQAFYAQLARVLRRRGALFHYTGTPNRLTSGRDVPKEVMQRLKAVGFTVTRHGDGILALKQ